MKFLIQKTRVYWLMMLAWWCVGAILLALFTKADLHLFLNQFHHPLLDVFFKYVTYLGDGLFAVIALFLITWFSMKKGFWAALGFGVSALITQALKRLVFDDVVRPSKFFEGIADLHFVSGVDLHSIYSFPSGHSTAAFALFTALALIYSKRNLQILFFVTALLAAFSRVYLSQHFVIDIVIGSIIGSTTSLIFLTIEKNITKSDRGLGDWIKSKFP